MIPAESPDRCAGGIHQDTVFFVKNVIFRGDSVVEFLKYTLFVMNVGSSQAWKRTLAAEKVGLSSLLLRTLTWHSSNT